MCRLEGSPQLPNDYWLQALVAGHELSRAVSCLSEALHQMVRHTATDAHCEDRGRVRIGPHELDRLLSVRDLPIGQHHEPAHMSVRHRALNDPLQWLQELRASQIRLNRPGMGARGLQAL